MEDRRINLQRNCVICNPCAENNGSIFKLCKCGNFHQLHDAVKCIVIAHNGRFKMPSANLLKTSHKLIR